MNDHVAIELDRKRQLRFSWDAICRLHDEHGINLLDLDEGAFNNPHTISAVLWAGLVEDDSGLTIDGVKKIISLPKLAYISQKVGEAIAGAMGTGDDPFAEPAATPTPSDSDHGSSAA